MTRENAITALCHPELVEGCGGVAPLARRLAARIAAWTLVAFALAGGAAVADDGSLATTARAVFASGTVGPIVERAPFAVANFNALVEGDRVPGQALFRRYPFGWQMLELRPMGYFGACDLRAHGVPIGSVQPLLVYGGRHVTRREPCERPALALAAPSADEVTLRRMQQNGNRYIEAIPWVNVDSGWAVVNWYGTGGGERPYRRTPSGWKAAAGGGGALDACGLIELGAPVNVAQRLAYAANADVRADAVALSRTAGCAVREKGSRGG